MKLYQQKKTEKCAIYIQKSVDNGTFLFYPVFAHGMCQKGSECDTILIGIVKQENQMKIGYIRATSLGEDTSQFEQELKEFGCEQIITDTYGKERPGMSELLRNLKPDDEVYSQSLERLARSASDFLNIVRSFLAADANLVVQRENISLNDPPFHYLLSTLIGFDEDAKQAARKEGIKKAKAAGKYLGSPGRPKNHTDWIEFSKYYRQWKNKEIKQADMCRKLHISRRTLDRRIKEFESIQTSFNSYFS